MGKYAGVLFSYGSDMTIMFVSLLSFSSGIILSGTAASSPPYRVLTHSPEEVVSAATTLMNNEGDRVSTVPFLCQRGIVASDVCALCYHYEDTQ